MHNSITKTVTRSVKICTYIAIGLLMQGCAKYTPKLLNNNVMHKQKKTDITIAAKALDALESKYYFANNLIEKNVRPIQLTICNKGDLPYVLDTKNIALQLHPADLVAQKLYFNTAKRVVSWALPALFVWPFLIPAVVDGIKSCKANNKIDEDIVLKSIDSHDVIVIHPHSVLNKIMFVHEQNYVPTFDVTLQAQNVSNNVSFKLTV